MRTSYAVGTTAAVALAAATAKSVLGVRGNAAFGLDLRKYTIDFDGVTASAVPVLVELCAATFATNPPGTNSTSRTAVQTGGRLIASGVTAASNWTAEPTVLTVLKEFYLTPNGGLIIEEFSPDNGYDSALSEGWVLRCTAPAIVNVRAVFEFQRG